MNYGKESILQSKKYFVSFTAAFVPVQTKDVV